MPKYLSLALVFLVPALGGLLYGFDIGCTAFAITVITAASSSPPNELAASALEQIGADDPWWAVTPRHPAFEEGLIVSAVSLGALVSSFVAFRVGDLWGRRAELRVAAILYLLGAGLNTLSGTLLAVGSPRILGVASLLAGRWTYGAGVGFAMHAAPTYMSEMTPPSVRGAVVTAKEAFIVLGMLLGYVVGYLVSGSNDNWYTPYASSAIISLIMLASTYSIPRSARWLMLQDNAEEAYESLRFLYVDEDEINKDFESIKAQIQEQRSLQSGGGNNASNSRSIFSRDVRQALIAGIGLVVFQQITGQPSIMTYVTIIFQEAGLGGGSSVLVSVFMLISTLATVATVDRYGRKTLLLAGCFLMMISLAVLSITFREQNLELGDADGGAKKYTLLAMLIYIGGYEIGFGPITWLLLSECFPLDIRGQAVATGVLVNFALNFLVQLVVPVLEEAFGLSATFAFFSTLTALSIVFIQWCVLETKGLSLEEVNDLFRTDERECIDEPTESDVLMPTIS